MFGHCVWWLVFCVRLVLLWSDTTGLKTDEMMALGVFSHGLVDLPIMQASVHPVREEECPRILQVMSIFAAPCLATPFERSCVAGGFVCATKEAGSLEIRISSRSFRDILTHASRDIRLIFRVSHSLKLFMAKDGGRAEISTRRQRVGRSQRGPRQLRPARPKSALADQRYLNGWLRLAEHLPRGDLHNFVLRWAVDCVWRRSRLGLVSSRSQQSDHFPPWRVDALAYRLFA